MLQFLTAKKTETMSLYLGFRLPSRLAQGEVPMHGSTRTIALYLIVPLINSCYNMSLYEGTCQHYLH